MHAAQQFDATPPRLSLAALGSTAGLLTGRHFDRTLRTLSGKGLGEHITAEPLRLAAQRGYHVGVLQSSEAGYNVYQRLGFQNPGGRPIFVRMP